MHERWTLEHTSRIVILAAAVWCVAVPGWAQSSFVNWESPHVHPLDMTPDGSRLLAVNTADNRLEVYDLSAGSPIHIRSVTVGLDPVAVRASGNTEAWVVNHISDSVSIVDLESFNVVRTLRTDDEPSDVVFAGTPRRAFVSCSQADRILVFDLADLNGPPQVIAIDADRPRAMAVSPDGAEVYVAIFESGNASTILGGGLTIAGGFPPNVVNDPDGPYGGINPPPNDGITFNPPLGDFDGDGTAGTPVPPAVGLIVRQDADGRWMDDNDGDWTEFVSGPLADRSGRPQGWHLPDRDVAIIDTSSLAVRYATRLMNICMAIAVNPANGELTVVGTDATNEVRFEPVLAGRFLRVNVARVRPSDAATLGIVDLNPHLVYTDEVPFVPLPQSEREKSLGDPRGIAWHADGTRGYVSGMGSDNVIVIDAAGGRAGLAPTIRVGEGPTGLALDEVRKRLYVLNRFEASLSVIDTDQEQEIARIPLYYDPTPEVIRIGRKHLYGTHRNSGLGHIACASCHVDARMDRLAWDLGNPLDQMKTFNQNCSNGVPLGPECEDWHPMKGPMTTQTLQDIIGKEPLHWRGDRDGIEEFAGTFKNLQGADEPLSPSDMAEFKAFLATIHFPPNPFRNVDNTLPEDLPLAGHFTTGRFAPAGQPLPNGDAVRGLNLYRTATLDGGLDCVSCHTLPVGVGSNYTFTPPFSFQPIPPGPNGELHHAIVSVDGSTNVSIKTPQLRNMYKKVGFEVSQTANRSGFGFLHDGSVDSLAQFVAEPVFSVASDQDVADLVAFMLAFAGSDLPTGSASTPSELPGPTGKDAHAAVGFQLTFDGLNNTEPGLVDLLAQLQSMADAASVGLVAKGNWNGEYRGFEYTGGGMMQSDRAVETVTVAALRLGADAGAEITFTVVPFGSQRRIGIDWDEDGYFDRDEMDACSHPANPDSIPGMHVVADLDCDSDVDEDDLALFADCWTGPSLGPPAPGCEGADFNGDGSVDQADFAVLQRCFSGRNVPADPACADPP